MQITPADYESLYINWTLAVISFTVLIYEYLLTFIYEVERFWPVWLKSLFAPRRFSGDSENDGTSSCFPWASFLFFMNRYLTIFGHVPVMLEYFWRIEDRGLRDKRWVLQSKVFYFIDVEIKKRCGHLQVYHQFLVILIQCLVASLMTIRIYALYGRKTWVAILYTGVALCTTGIGVWAVIANTINVGSPPVYVPYGCGKTLTETGAHYLGLAWLGELVFDVLIFVMTLYKTLSLPNGNGVGLLSMLIRDGAVYFGAMVAFNIGNITTFFAGGPLSRGSLTMLTNIGSSILVSRLMLNLRDPKLSRTKAKNDWTDESPGWNRRYDLQGVMVTTAIDTGYWEGDDCISTT